MAVKSFKPEVEPGRLRDLLIGHLGSSVGAITPIEQGHIARVFACAAGGSAYVIRFNRDNMDANFEKEAFVTRAFSSAAVPIPPVIAVGRMDELHYCITRRAPGMTVNLLTPAERADALPSILETLEAIHDCDAGRFEGYGLFDGAGRGLAASWKEYLLSVSDEEREGGFFGRWHGLFEETFLERDVFRAVHSEMARRIERSPGDRRLVHGGYAFRNILVAGGRVTAVIDWLDAKWGDPLYDIAYADFWQPECGIRNMVLSRAAARDIAIPDFGDRVLCYQCYTALDAFRFFALRRDEEAYRWTKDRIAQVLGEGSPGRLP